ncbi:MAG: TIGR02757 family protein [Bacteroidales bacterium]|nr:TIGR02757 family protein [Bacteroidales bacterium]
MIPQESINQLIELSEAYNKECYFEGDPIIFPKHFALIMEGKDGIFKFTNKEIRCVPSMQDVEIAGIIAAHLAWGRRDMIIRDCKRAFDEMGWRPYDYVMAGRYRDDDASLHRTIKWSEFAQICSNLREYFSKNETLETIDADKIRVDIFGQKSNPKAANKKIHMFRRWMVRNDGVVDLGLWKNTSPATLTIPLDVHVHRSAINLGITSRKSADLTTAMEITDFLKTVFPDDPCKGDFALFAYAATKLKEQEQAKKR